MGGQLRFENVLFLGLILLGCAETELPETVVPETAGLEREITGFSLTETNEGTRVWELKADYAWRIPKDTRVRLKNVTLVFFDSTGEITSWLTSEKGHADEESGEMTAESRVILISVDGDTLTTEELIYSRDTEMIRGPGFVRLAKPDRVMTGFEFESKPDLSNYEVRHDVTITVTGGSEP